MEHFNVSVVCHGQTPIMPCEDGSDPYIEPKKQDKFKLLDSGNDMTTEKIVERIILHRYVPSLQARIMYAFSLSDFLRTIF